MAKEIHERPEVVGHTLARYIDMAALKLKPFAWPADPTRLTRVTIVGCGTAYMAGLVAKYWIERLARLPVEIDVASEYRYREAPVNLAGELLRAILLQALYLIRSERQLMERLEFDLLFRWFVGIGVDVWDHSTFPRTASACWRATCRQALGAVLAQPRVKRLLSTDRFPSMAR